MHTYKRADCRALIQAKALPCKITSIGGIDRFVDGLNSKSEVIKNWDELYARLSAMEDPRHPIDPKGMTDEELAAGGKSE